MISTLKRTSDDKHQSSSVQCSDRVRRCTLGALENNGDAQRLIRFRYLTLNAPIACSLFPVAASDERWGRE